MATSIVIIAESVSACRQALEEEADVLCLLAKVDRGGLAFNDANGNATDDKDGSITVVVQEGLEVLLPMAGTSFTAECCMVLSTKAHWCMSRTLLVCCTQSIRSVHSGQRW